MFGPFYVENAPQYPLGADLARGAKGEPCYVQATKWERHPPGRAPDGTHSAIPFHTLKFDFVLNKGGA